ncbi:hypothetical protein KW786_02295 [Candidatus Parcubacteria bacterium]|nr:hypothetical protein [Candidatus Parcubacteria bacterium]
MEKDKFFTKKLILPSIGTIVLALITNAIWENFFRDLLNWLVRIILNVSTFGIKKYQDGIYADVARGFYERSSLEILLIIVCGFSALTLLITFSHFGKFVFRQSETKIKIKEFIGSFIRGNSLVSLLPRLYVLFFAIILIANVARMAYVNELIAYHNQLLRIIAPHISEEENKIFLSKFAQIQHKSDYEKDVKELEEIILENNVKLPEKPSI